MSKAVVAMMALAPVLGGSVTISTPRPASSQTSRIPTYAELSPKQQLLLQGFFHNGTAQAATQWQAMARKQPQRATTFVSDTNALDTMHVVLDKEDVQRAPRGDIVFVDSENETHTALDMVDSISAIGSGGSDLVLNEKTFHQWQGNGGLYFVPLSANADDDTAYYGRLHPGLNAEGNIYDGAVPTFHMSLDPTTVPGAHLKARKDGTVDPHQLQRYLEKRVSHTKLNGYVPPDGAEFGIDGTPASWARYMVKLCDRESSFNARDISEPDDFRGGSRGLFQLSFDDPSNYGVHGGVPFTAEELADPQINADTAIAIQEKLILEKGSIHHGAGSYWSPIGNWASN